MIEVNHLTKRYGPLTAVDGLTFTIREGQVYGFLGPNGAGKTTTMNMMTGYLAPTEGTVTVNGFDITADPVRAKRTIGYLPEVPPLYPDMTVREYLRFTAELKGIARAERKEEVQRVIGELSLKEMENRLIRALSKGYRQRTGMAAALLGNPETLIFDEPTAGLDPRQITEIRALIKTLGKSHTVLLSSHILSEVSEICDTVLILDKGKMTAVGTPEELSDASRKITVSILTDGADAKIRRALAGAADGHEITIDKEDGHMRVRIAGEEDSNFRAGISRALAAAGLPVYEIGTEKASLEDIFLSLTKEDD